MNRQRRCTPPIDTRFVVWLGLLFASAEQLGNNVPKVQDDQILGAAEAGVHAIAPLLWSRPTASPRHGWHTAAARAARAPGFR